MQFTPQSETEIRSEMMLPDGEYDFEVEGAEETISKNSGNEMIVLNLRVFDPKGGSCLVRDWLVSSDKPLCKLKVRNFCEAVGILDSYESGTLDAVTCNGAAGRLVLGHQDSPSYGPQNSVVDYCKPSRPVTEPQPPLGVPASQAKAARAAAEVRGEDPDIPF